MTYISKHNVPQTHCNPMCHILFFCAPYNYSCWGSLPFPLQRTVPVSLSPRPNQLLAFFTSVHCFFFHRKPSENQTTTLTAFPQHTSPAHETLPCKMNGAFEISMRDVVVARSLTIGILPMRRGGKSSQRGEPRLQRGAGRDSDASLGHRAAQSVGWEQAMVHMLLEEIYTVWRMDLA